MSKKNVVAITVLLTLILGACQNDNHHDADDDIEQSKTEEVEPDTPTDETSVAADESDEESGDQEDTDEDSGDQEDTDEDVDTSDHETDVRVSELVEEENYNNEEEAIEAIEDYRIIEQTNVDLGYGIEGSADAGTGHYHVSWNEGNWLIAIDFPLDPQFAVETYEDGESMAKAIVEYLEDHILPPPDQRGVIRISGFKDHPETTIRWQQGSNVYEIEQETADPLEALQIAVDYQNNQ